MATFYETYGTSISYSALIIMGALFIILKNEISIGIKRRFFAVKGWINIVMWMPDRQEKEAFVNLKNNPVVQFFDRTYVFDVKTGVMRAFEVDVVDKKKNEKPKPKSVMLDEYKLNFDSIARKGKHAKFYFRWDRTEPIDPYNLDKKFDSGHIDAIILRVKAQGGIKDLLKLNKMIKYLLIGSAAGSAAAAYFAYQAYIVLRDSGVASGGGIL